MPVPFVYIIYPPFAFFNVVQKIVLESTILAATDSLKRCILREILKLS